MNVKFEWVQEAMKEEQEEQAFVFPAERGIARRGCEIKKLFKFFSWEKEQHGCMLTGRIPQMGPKRLCRREGRDSLKRGQDRKQGWS